MTLSKLATELVAEAAQRQLTVATAESLTGGLVASSLTSVAGASAVFRGGVVSYATEVKRELLGVDGDLLAAVGAVDGQVAGVMAERARVVTGTDGRDTDIGIATTGVAGPDTQDGHPVGEVFVAVATKSVTRVERFEFSGSRNEIRTSAAAAAIELALEVVRES